MTRLSSTSTTQALPDKPWHAYITIDLLLSVLKRTIFHPFIAWLIPLCMRSLSYPYTHSHFQYTFAYAIVITLFALLYKLDKRLAWGPPRQLDWDSEVVVITGGASGLGKLLAETYGMRGVSVAVLDIRVPEERESEGLENVHFYKCDVSDLAEVQKAKASIEKDVRRLPEQMKSHESLQTNVNTSARRSNNPDKQRRHRLRLLPPHSPTRADYPHTNHQPALTLPHASNLPPKPPRLAHRRHGRNHLFRTRPSRRLTPNRLRRGESRPDRHARLPPRRAERSVRTQRRRERPHRAPDARPARHEPVRRGADAEFILGAGGGGAPVGGGDCKDCGRRGERGGKSAAVCEVGGGVVGAAV